MEVTLDTLSKMRPLLNVSALARAVGMPEATLYARLQRGSPDLSDEEAEHIETALYEHNIRPL